ncbi:DNA-processing protein DprA [Fodinicola feengrottensis]|uniref:DNA-processing protein DprA n=1 Tax=Fodinicola feengrottensis TaxID=435914 RepID=A0ABN2H4W7_9ACTN
MTSTETLVLDEERRGRAALTALVEPGDDRVRLAAERVGAADLVRRIASQREDSQRMDPFDLADRLLEKAAKVGARLAIPGDAEWPEASLFGLARLAARRQALVASGSSVSTIERSVAPPVALWLRGPLRLADTVRQSVAVVGSRAASGYGSHVTAELSYGLAIRDWTVVSGGAYGIDGSAHRGALAADGQTVAVLACGVDVPYPPGHAGLFDQIAHSGLLVSEWPPGTTPRRPRFLVRNRVIAALTAGTVVVEAGARSGARATARRATELGRVVMAVPGPVNSGTSVGCHQLLRSGLAILVTRAEEVLEEVGRIGADLADLPRAPDGWRDRLDEVSAAVVEAMPAMDWVSASTLCEAISFPADQVTTALAGLVEAARLHRDADRYRLAAGARTTPTSARPSIR